MYVETCMKLGLEIHKKTPPSITFRKYDNPKNNNTYNDEVEFCQFPVK